MLRSVSTTAMAMLAAASIGCSQEVPPIQTPGRLPLPPPPPPATKRVGKAEVLYAAQSDRTSARVYVYVLGTSTEVPERKKEVITLEMGYSVPGRIAVKPESVFLRLVSYSPDVPKYADSHDLIITVDGKVLMTDEAFDWDANDHPRPTASEAYGLSKMRFPDFERIAAADTLSIQLGATKIELTGEPLDAIRDLLKTVEK